MVKAEKNNFGEQIMDLFLWPLVRHSLICCTSWRELLRIFSPETYPSNGNSQARGNYLWLSGGGIMRATFRGVHKSVINDNKKNTVLDLVLEYNIIVM